ncbi:hypothetical protein TWF730_005310 [Orbilia blumenaviensis]|uniref:Uncharacterized protein n=1 Tax=Orbilia blumenaviensis TaxID=1796055 RepID=A0AAV9VKB3_9PEZI
MQHPLCDIGQPIPKPSSPPICHLIDDDGFGYFTVASLIGHNHSRRYNGSSRRPIIFTDLKEETSFANRMPPSKVPPSKKASKQPQPQDDDNVSNIRWSKALELALAGRMVDEYNSKYVANKAATSKRWASDIGILDTDPRGKKTKHHITKMVLDWKKTWDWSQSTGRGDLERDGVIVSLEQQCIEKCHYFKALLPVFGSSSSVQPSAQLTSTGRISTASVGVSQVGGGHQQQAAEAEAEADAEAEDDEDEDEDDEEVEAPAGWRDSDDEDRASKGGDEDEDGGQLNGTDLASSKEIASQPTPVSRASSITPRQFMNPVATPSKLTLSFRQGKRMSAIDEMRAMIQAPVEAQKAKYEAKVAIAKSELDKEKAQKEHELKMARLSILQKEQERSHEIAILNAKAEIDHYNAEIERLKLKRSMGLDLTDEEKNFICQPAPKMPTIAAPKSILDDPDLVIITTRPAVKRSDYSSLVKQEREPERKTNKRKLGPDATPSTTIGLESTRTPTTTQRGQINDVTPTVKRPSKKPKPSTDALEKQSVSDSDPTSKTSTPAASDGGASPAIEPVLARIRRASITTIKAGDKAGDKAGEKKPDTKATTKTSKMQPEPQPSQTNVGVPQASQGPAPGQRPPFDPGYPDEFYRNLQVDEETFYNEGYQRMLQNVPHMMNEAWQGHGYAPNKNMYRDYESAGPQMPRFYGDEPLSGDDQTPRHQRGLDPRNMFFNSPHPGRFNGPRAGHPRHPAIGHHPHPMYPHPYPPYPYPPSFGEGGQVPVPGRADYRSTSPDTVITAASEAGPDPALGETDNT